MSEASTADVPSSQISLTTESTAETTETQKKKQLPRSERDKKTTPCPARSPVKVFEIGKGQEFSEAKVFVRGKPTKSQGFQIVDNKRQASRLGFQKSLMREMQKVKTTTNDDVFLAYRKSEKKPGDLAKYTTSRDFVFFPMMENPLLRTLATLL